MSYVLVVDDEPSMCQFVRMVLEGEGYSVTTAAHGKQALEQIGQRRPEMLLLDLNMPVMNGWELHETLRQRGETIAIVYMTAGRSAKAEAEAHHADAYLAKPFGVDALLDIVSRFAGEPRAHQNGSAAGSSAAERPK